MKKVAIASLCFLPCVAFAGVTNAFDQAAIYGQIIGTPSTISASGTKEAISASGGNTVGGIGVTASGVNSSLWYTHLGFNYGFGAPINGGSVSGSLHGSANGSGYVQGHSLQFNARIGKLFQVTPNMAVGPYLAYQYANFSIGLDNIGTASYDNNAIGGGIEAGIDAGDGLTFTGHAGYLAGVSASADVGGSSASNTPSSDVLQIGFRGTYSFDSQWGVFAGVDYDRYHASDGYAPDGITGSATINEVRGLVGVSYGYQK